MAKQTTPTTKKPVHPHKDRATEIANTFEWLITAFILAFVFRAFVMEAFRIPTGSMADTLMGAHFRVGCPECGYSYAHGFTPQSYHMKADTMPSKAIPLRRAVRCPSCGFMMQDTPTSPTALPVDNGDRILVLKCLYQFVEPRRWDVIVFKNPLNPAENYIKRLIGLPEEEIEIVDGDIFIDGRIARKPAKVQRELWMPIYNHDYQPVHPDRHAFNRRPWQFPFDIAQSDWQADPEDPTQLLLDSHTAELQRLTYGADSANNSRATYAYNPSAEYGRRPTSSDLKIEFHAVSNDVTGPIGASIRKYGVQYEGLVFPDGRMTLTRTTPAGVKTELNRMEDTGLRPNSPTPMQFCVVDRRVILHCGNQTLSADLADERDGLAMDKQHEPQVAILGSGYWKLSHVQVYRDIHYTSQSRYHQKSRATEGKPFTLETDQFFVLGDNSPNSEDGRWWRKPTLASRGQQPPRDGVVPRHYLVGKALFVYWPSGYAFPWPKPIQNLVDKSEGRNGLMRIVRTLVKLRWIPNVGQMRFIYGGEKPGPDLQLEDNRTQTAQILESHP